jgi:hypothetical protein
MHHLTISWSAQAAASIIGGAAWLLVPDKYPRLREGCRILMAAGFFSFLFKV